MGGAIVVRLDHPKAEILDTTAGKGGAAALPEGAAAAQPDLRTWIVEWSVPIALGGNAWEDGDGVVPHASYSFAPEIGRAHESRYQPLAEDAP